ncbi:MAG: site-specific DNA-methyltransferase [Betaproteobacteria bacterium]|nr:site-specific DNA-methyltransferase [Betaproteobacteria bacterium]
MPTLDWIGKEAVVKHHKEVPYRLLEPVPELSCGDAASGHLIVQGDNLHALKALLPRYAGQVKCIYIDPPYNTGNEGWAYNDSVNSPEIRKWLSEVVGKEGEDLSRHDKWLCMMYPRLVLLKQFLREDGTIFVSIDDNEVASLRMLIDEVFGRRNFVASIAWQRRTSPDARLGLSQAHDHILVSAKNAELLKFNPVPLSQEQSTNFKNPDNDSRGPWVSTDFTAQGWRPNQMYEIVTPGGSKYSPPPGRCWSNIESAYRSLVDEGRMWFGRDGKARPRVKTYLSETSGVSAWSWWTNEDCGHNQEAKKEINEILGFEVPFDTPKPTRLIRRILQIATNKNSLILDSFAGSGTTGHAVLKQNAEDGGNRRFILVEMDNNIARNVTAERVRRVCSGYTNAKGEQIEGLGGDFQFCKLSDEPLFTPEGQIRKDVTFPQLAEFVWFAETGTGIAGKPESPLLGIHEGRAVYLLYNGILKDRSANGGNVLTAPVYDALPSYDGPKVVYAAACRLGAARLAREGIVFKQTPYALEV